MPGVVTKNEREDAFPILEEDDDLQMSAKTAGDLARRNSGTFFALLQQCKNSRLLHAQKQNLLSV